MNFVQSNEASCFFNVISFVFWLGKSSIQVVVAPEAKALPRDFEVSDA